MNLDELRSVQSKERQKDSLQNLRPSFYQEVGEYIADLEDERDRAAERADDPFSSPEVGRLTDEIETARDVVEAIYERRMGKLVKQASLAAAGMSADDEGLTAEEKALFEDLVDRIRTNKTRVLDVLEGTETEGESGSEGGAERTGDAAAGTAAPDPDPDGAESSALGADEPPIDPVDDAPPVPAAASGTGTEAPDSTPDSSSGTASGLSPADAMGDGSASTEDPSPSPPAGNDGEANGPSATETDDGDDASADGAETAGDVDRVTVRITRDIGSILGVDDREYTLSSDDVVTLPAENADPLVEREAAEPLE